MGLALEAVDGALVALFDQTNTATIAHVQDHTPSSWRWLVEHSHKGVVAATVWVDDIVAIASAGPPHRRPRQDRSHRCRGRRRGGHVAIDHVVITPAAYLVVIFATTDGVVSALPWT